MSILCVWFLAVLTCHVGNCSPFLRNHQAKRSVDVMTGYWGLQYVVTTIPGPRPRDCAEVQEQGSTQSGVYHVFVGPNRKPIRVFCDLESQGGGWLVFQRRQDGFQDFQQNWDKYARGFGDLFGEFWLGNHFLHLITQQKEYKLRVDLEDFDNSTRHAEYSSMTVNAPFDKYRLHIGNYSGDAGDSLWYHSNRKFSTIEQDNDDHQRNCAASYRGGWWYEACHGANLNGLYLGGVHSSYANGVDWKDWRGYHYSLKTSVMKIRPVNFS